MKKLILAFGFLVFMTSLTPADAAVINYWDYWNARSNNVTSSQATTPRTTYRTIPRTTTRTTTSSRSTSTTNTSSGQSRWMNYLRAKYADRLSARNTTTSTPSYSRTNTVSTQRSTAAGVRATATPITLRQTDNDITEGPVSLFRLGFSHNASGSNFTEAVNIDEVQFQITDNTGVVSNFRDFDLVIEGQDFNFNAQGFATVRFNNLRLARSEDRAVDVSIKVDDPNSFARFPGSFRVKMTDVTAYRENSGQSVQVGISGRSVSDYIVLNPRPSVSAGGTSTANITNSQTIVGRPLGGGEKAFLLSFSLNAAFDDFFLESLTVRNQFGSNADRLVGNVRLVNLETGAVLDTTRFVGGRATFDMPRNQQVVIPRTTRVKLGIEAEIVDRPDTDNLDNRLSLLLSADDVELFGYGSGRDVPNSQKNVSVDSETFTVTTGSLTAQGGIYFSTNQPAFFPTRSLNQVARFKITNAGNRDVSFGRFSLQVTPNGVDFVGGGTTSDVQLVELFNGVTQFPRFTTTSMSGNIATFDATSEIFVEGGQTREFALLAALENTGSSNDSDGVAVVILGDNNLTTGTLSSVKASGARFIWSDHSGAPHTTNSTDWLSGFQFSGVPTNAFVNTRR